MVQVELGFEEDTEYEGEGGFEDDGYETYWLNDMDVGDSFSGICTLGKIKDGDYGEKCFLTISNAENEEKLIIGLNTKLVDEGEEVKIYAWKNSVLYDFVDSLYEQLKGTKRNVVKRYKLNFEQFETFRKTVNEKIDEMTVKIHENTFEDDDSGEEKPFNSFAVTEVTLLGK